MKAVRAFHENYLRCPITRAEMKFQFVIRVTKTFLSKLAVQRYDLTTQKLFFFQKKIGFYLIDSWSRSLKNVNHARQSGYLVSFRFLKVTSSDYFFLTLSESGILFARAFLRQGTSNL